MKKVKRKLPVKDAAVVGPISASVVSSETKANKQSNHLLIILIPL